MMRVHVLNIDPRVPDKTIIQFAAMLLKNGGLVAFPTETVYGIGANLLDENAIKRLYEIKKRPADKPFTVHISSIDTIAKMHCNISPFAERLMDRFWPGPLTIILTSEKGKIGFRMPKNAVAKDVISKSDVPLVVPSANISGEKPPTTAHEIAENLGEKIDLILDGGPTEFGTESTVVDATAKPYTILRKGAISETNIAEVWNEIRL